MEAYFEELLHRVNTNANSDHEADTPIEDEEYVIQPPDTTPPIHNSDSDTQISNHDSDTQINGGKNKRTINIIYSFISPILQLLHLTAPNIKLYDTTPDIKQIIKSVHNGLENKFTTSEQIANQIISKLVETIISSTANHDYIYVSVGSKSAPFNLTSFFSKLTSADTQHKYILKFINPDFDCLLDQVIKNYNSTHHRLTLNEDILHIIKHYNQTQQSTSHAITFDKSSIDLSFTRISSAFTDSNDKSSFVDLFIHRLNPSSPATYSVIHTFASSSNPNIEVIDTPKSTLTPESFKPILRQIVEQ